MDEQLNGKVNGKALDRYLSPTDVWGMAFGCMVGWGVFAMPGTAFLPVAGPAGTLIAMLIGMVIMLVIGSNFAFLMGRSSMTGGVYSYTKEAFGRDHAFLSSWFLCLSYLTISDHHFPERYGALFHRADTVCRHGKQRLPLYGGGQRHLSRRDARFGARAGGRRRPVRLCKASAAAAAYSQRHSTGITTLS